MTASCIADWRQCDTFVLSELGSTSELIPAAHHDQNGVYIVLTHSCSVSILDFGKEPLVEYILARPITKKDNAYVGRNNRRILHLDLHVDGEAKPYGLLIHERGFFDRKVLDGISPTKGCLDEKSKELIIKWIASRYNAPAFPDEFNKRFKPCEKHIGDKFKQIGTSFTAAYIIVDPVDEELNAVSPYEVNILLSVEADIESAEYNRCENIVEELKEKLVNNNEIDFLGEKVSLLREDQITLAMIRGTKILLLDYLSERETPGGEFPAQT